MEYEDEAGWRCSKCHRWLEACDYPCEKCFALVPKELLEWVEEFRTLCKTSRARFINAEQVWDSAQPGILYNKLNQIMPETENK